MNLAALCLRVVQLSKEVGNFIRREGADFDPSRIEHKGRNDLVSYVDQEAERRLVKTLGELLPEARFIAEEGTESVDFSDPTKLSGYHWVIDPLDGTTNFLHNFPMHAVSVGLLRDQTPVLGVVYEISQDECFYAWQGGGAYRDDFPIRVSAVAHLTDSLLITGFPYQQNPNQMARLLDIFQHFVQNTHGVRRLGSAATDLAYVACGRGEGFYECNLKPWDLAAGVVLVQEAGGTVTDFRGGDNYVFGRELVAGGPVQAAMQQAIGARW